MRVVAPYECACFRRTSAPIRFGRMRPKCALDADLYRSFRTRALPREERERPASCVYRGGCYSGNIRALQCFPLRRRTIIARNRDISALSGAMRSHHRETMPDHRRKAARAIVATASSSSLPRNLNSPTSENG